MTPFAPQALSPLRLPAGELATVARVLGCPDLFILDCAEAATRERYILHVVRTAALNGERLLVLSPDPDAADRLVETLSTDRSIRVVRALSDDENPLRPTAAVTRLTSANAGANRAEQLRREATQTVSRLESKLAGIHRSRECHARLGSVEAERREVLDSLTRIEAEIRSRPSASNSDAANRCRDIQIERESIRTRRVELERAPATKSGILSRLFSFGKPAAGTDCAEELKRLADRDAALIAECDAVTKERADTTEKQLLAEIAALQSGPRQRLQELEREVARVDAELRELHPQAASEDTVENGNPSRNSVSDLEHELAVARTRAQELSAAGADLPRTLLAETQIVVGTPGSLETDPVFAALGASRFDRLILDHAEELNEAAFDGLSPLADRWVLAGDASPPPSGRPTRGRPAGPTLLHHLSRTLDQEPWVFEGDRLIVRLIHLDARSRGNLTREPLLDHPDVELGMQTVDGEPVLAEITFPAGTAIAAAKAFLVTQLGEVVLRTCGEPDWRVDDVSYSAEWPYFEAGDGEWIELDSGIRERVAGSGSSAFTAEVRFDRATWDEAAAREWLDSKVGPSSSRLAVLPCSRQARYPAFAH